MHVTDTRVGEAPTLSPNRAEPRHHLSGLSAVHGGPVQNKQIFRLPFNAEIVAAEPEEGSDEQKPSYMTASDFNKAMSSREAKMLSRIETLISASTPEAASDAFDMDKLDVMIEKLVDSGPQTQQMSDDDSEAPSHKGDRAEVDQIRRQMKKLQDRLDVSVQDSEDKDKKMVAQRRRHTLLDNLNKASAINSEQVSKLLFDQIVNDDELGDAISVTTETGEDLVSVEKYIPIFKEDNPHLFQGDGPNKSGSGSGGGGAAKGQAVVTSESLANMSQADYESQRAKIHDSLEANRG